MRNLLVLFLLCCPRLSAAELVTYTDEAGRTHYVEGLDRVPDRFRGTANTAPKLGQITKSPHVLYKTAAEKVPGKHGASAGHATKKVEVFVTSWCPYCKKLEAHLQSRNIPYKRYDVEKDEAGADIFRSLGLGGGVPVTRVGNVVIEGFQPEKIEEVAHQ
jgi:glutaredoxin